MKILRTSSGNKIKISKSEWESIGKESGWVKTAQSEESYDIILKYYPGDGFLPLIQKNGEEIYRGEYKDSSQEALSKATTWMESRQIDKSLENEEVSDIPGFEGTLDQLNNL